MLKKGIALLGIVGLIGCASAETFRTSANTYPQVPQDQVRLFFDKADISEPYEVVGEIMMSGSSGWGSDCNDLIKKAQKKAGQMGANAILAHDCNDPSAGKRFAAALFGTQDNKARVQALRLNP